MLGLEKLLESLLKELVNSNGKPALDRYKSLALVEEKQIELQVLLGGLATSGKYLQQKLEKDQALHSDIAARRLNALVAYIRTTLRLLQEGVLKAQGTHLPAPDFTALARTMPGLEVLAGQRWEEIQCCIDAEAYLSATIQMGSLLEGLALARVIQGGSAIERCKSLPRHKNGAMKPQQEWRLDQLLAVAVEMGWVKSASADIHDSLGKFRSLINPWEQMSAGLAVDLELCMINWRATNKAVEDLLGSV